MYKFTVIFILFTMFHSLQAKEFSYGHDTRQKLDYFEKKGVEKVLFFVHGGAWIVGDKRSSLHKKRELDMGLITINYSLNTSIENQVKDTYAAYKKAKSLIGPNKKLILSGHSAGAQLVLMAFLKYNLKEDIIVVDTSYNYMKKKGSLYTAWNGYSKERRAALSPELNLRKTNSKILIIASKKNKKDSKIFFKKLKKFAPNAKLLQTKYSHGKVNKIIGDKKHKSYYNTFNLF